VTDPELPVVAVDQAVNLKALRGLQREGRIVLVQAHHLEQSFRSVMDQGRAFKVNVSALDGPDMIAGDNVHDVVRIIGKDKMADVEHVYASWLHGNDYLVTENVDDFIRGGRREQLRAALPGLWIGTTDEFLQEFGSS
jgi:hypothetical protein